MHKKRGLTIREVTSEIAKLLTFELKRWQQIGHRSNQGNEHTLTRLLGLVWLQFI